MFSMQKVREWTGIQQFPAATQQKLHELLGKLKNDNVSTLTILVMGKGGVGKSSTVNSLLGERVAPVSAFQSEGLRPMIFPRVRAGFTLNIIDTPGLVEGGYVNEHSLDNIKRFLLDKTIDVFLYVDRLDAYRVDNLDRLVIKAITDTFGKQIWKRGVIVLTHAQLSPPDGLSYDDFLAKRSEALMNVIRSGVAIKNRELQDYDIPISLVENSGRCNTNENSEKVLPNGICWIPEMVKTITNVISNGSKAIYVDQKLIDGPDPNLRGKMFIPLILAFQNHPHLFPFQFLWHELLFLSNLGGFNFFSISFFLNNMSGFNFFSISSSSTISVALDPLESASSVSTLNSRGSVIFKFIRSDSLATCDFEVKDLSDVFLPQFFLLTCFFSLHLSKILLVFPRDEC